jgi:hypothetical protein
MRDERADLKERDEEVCVTVLDHSIHQVELPIPRTGRRGRLVLPRRRQPPHTLLRHPGPLSCPLVLYLVPAPP